MSSIVNVFVINIDNSGARQYAKKLTRDYNPDDYYFSVPNGYFEYAVGGNTAASFDSSICENPLFGPLIPCGTEDLLNCKKESIVKFMKSLSEEDFNALLFYTLDKDFHLETCNFFLGIEREGEVPVEVFTTGRSDEELPRDPQVFSFLRSLKGIVYTSNEIYEKKKSKRQEEPLWVLN